MKLDLVDRHFQSSRTITDKPQADIAMPGVKSDGSGDPDEGRGSAFENEASAADL